MEEAKQRSDWAYSTRDKIVQERESIRALCDKLRHERDNAISELIGALRDSDEVRKQKNDALKELKELQWVSRGNLCEPAEWLANTAKTLLSSIIFRLAILTKVLSQMSMKLI